MKTLHDIEQHARELAGGEFEVVNTGHSVMVSWRSSRAVFWDDGRSHFALTAYSEDYELAFLFVSLCSQLDTWIKGGAE